METGAGGRGGVVLGLMVSSSVEHGAGTVATGSHLHALVIFWDQLRIETGGGVHVVGFINDLCLENITRLLSDTLS